MAEKNTLSCRKIPTSGYFLQEGTALHSLFIKKKFHPKHTALLDESSETILPIKQTTCPSL
jgi:hypothetical protein